MRVGVVLFLAALGLGAAQQLRKQISFPGVGQNGIFDPSIAATPKGQRAWMSYSAVNPSSMFGERNRRVISTRLAYSDDGGSTWTDSGETVNPTRDVPIGAKAGTWVSEVSSLVFDPFAPANERWKLFWHHYLRVNEDGQFQNGWIGYRGAPSPTGLATAAEVKLFGGRGYNKDNNSRTGDNRSPLAGPPAIAVQDLNPDLGMCVALSEPGGMATASGLYLALTCYRPKVANPIGLLGIGLFGVTNDVVLMKLEPNQPAAEPRAWRFLGTPLSVADAQSAGFLAYSAPDLFEQDGRYYLMASPVSNTPGKGAYNGCRIFRFADIGSGRLERDSGGNPRVIQEANGRPGSFNGACTYQPTVAGSGFVYSQLQINGSQPFFEIYQTGTGLLESE